MEEPTEQGDRDELTHIASVLSRQFTADNVTNEASCQLDSSPALDPESDQFDLERWMQYFIQQLGTAGHNPTGAGVLFRDLSVHGTGRDIQLQDTVASVAKSILRPGELFTLNRKEPKHILHDLDGLVRRGEMLVVLGRPGSGCSTFLKTLCGELHGLHVDSGSTVNFDGIPHARMQKEFKGEAIYNQEVSICVFHLRKYACFFKL